MDDDVFNGFSYGENDDWGNAGETTEPNENSGDVDLTRVTSNAPIQMVAKASRIAELYDPLNWFYNIPVSAKKSKIEDDSGIIAFTTKRIVDSKLRRKAVLIENNGQPTEEKKIELLRYPPLRGEQWMGISCPDNYERRYLTLDEVKTKEAKPKLSMANSHIKKIIHELLFDYCPKKFRLVPSSKIYPRAVSSADDSDVLCTSPVQPSTDSMKLWIDKYAPITFFDLLTQDSNNRITLSWLNLWNEYIFDKPTVYERLTPAEQQLLEIEASKPFLPKKKVMIIHGPSGCGKTSLAIMAAKVKYDPFLINMNEITNATELNSALLHSMANHSISFNPASRKPRCLILDGIEYASKDVINALKKWVLTRKKDNALKPMICTCNNVYAPNLREFRNMCFVLKVNVDRVRFFDQMQKICQFEHIQISNLALKNFVEQCQSDIRLCLNNLQFRCPSGRANKLTKENIDSKMLDFSIFDAIDIVLRLNKHTDNRGFLKSAKERFENISATVSQRPDFAKFSNIIFNNIPEACKATPKQIVQADKWFIEADLLSTLAYSCQDFSLLKYQNASLVAVHFATASQTNRYVKISLPVLNINESRRGAINMLNSVRFSKANLKHYRSILGFVIDVLPSIFYIIQPPMQVSSSSMFHNDDKVNHIVEIMAAYGLGLKAVIENGVMDYVFEPPINEIVSYFLTSRHNNLSLPPSVRTYIVRNLEMHNDVDDVEIIKTVGPSDKAVPQRSDAWSFKYTSASAQAIKRGIQLQSFLPSLE